MKSTQSTANDVTGMLTRRVALLGWYGEGAHGDDLMGRATKRALRAEAAKRNWNIEWCEPQWAELIVVGGGTILGVDSMDLCGLVGDSRAPLVIMGGGFRRESRAIGDEHVARMHGLFERARLKGVRGYLSQQFLVHIGIEDVEVIGDPAVLVDPVPVPALPAGFKIGIAVRSMSRHGEPQYTSNERMTEAIACICDELLQRHDATLYFFDLTENDHDSDAEGIQSVLAKLRRPAKHVVVPYETGAEESFSILGQMDYILSQRLHPTILGWIQGIPHVAIDYQFGKTEDFMGSIGMGEFLMRSDELDLPRYLQKMTRILAEREIVREQAIKSVEYWRRRHRDFVARAISLLDESAGSSSRGGSRA